MRPLRQSQKFFVMFLIVMVISAVSAGQTVLGTVPVGSEPNAVVVNEETNMIYVANQDSASVTVINGLTDATTSVPVGGSPYGMAINSLTNTIYVATASYTLTAINGATNATETISLGATSYGVAVNPVTNMIYVANSNSNTITAINGATNATQTITVGTYPWHVAVNPVTNTIYAANPGSNNVSVINGATGAVTATIPVGSVPIEVAVNPVTNMIYVSNCGDGSNNYVYCGGSGNGSVTAINGANNTTTTITAGTNPFALAVNPVTNNIYVANMESNTVTVINGATNTTQSVATGTLPISVAVNTLTNKVYVANYGSGNATVIDGVTNAATTTPSVAGAEPTAVAVSTTTNRAYVTNWGGVNTVTVIDGALNTTQTVATGSVPYGVAVNPATSTIYVPNWESNNVTVVNATTLTTQTVPAGTTPYAVAVNPLTNTVYVPNYNGGNPSTVTVINGETNATQQVNVGSGPIALDLNPLTNMIYVANCQSNNVTVINGATNATQTVPTGTYPMAVAVNPVTNKIFVANGNSFNVTVIDGITNATQTISTGYGSTALAVNPVTNMIYVANTFAGTVTIINGATYATQTVTAGNHPSAVAVNQLTNMIYVVNNFDDTVTIINGTTNATQTMAVGGSPGAVLVNPLSNKIYVSNELSGTVTVIDGASNATETVTVGQNPYLMAIDPLLPDHIYVVNYSVESNSLSIILEQEVYSNPLTTTISTLPNNQTVQGPITFDFTASSSFSPTAPPPQAVWYQLDGFEGPWLRASGVAPYFSATLTGVPLGIHYLYAFATDGQDSNSTGMEQQLIGFKNRYMFAVVPATTTTTLSSNPNPADVGQWIQFTATTTESYPGTATPTGTVTFFDGTTSLASVSVGTNGQAVFFTQSLAAGTHSITASYSGDINNLASTSSVLSEQVYVAAVSVSPTSLSFGNQLVGTTSAGQAVLLTNNTGQTLSFSTIEATTNFTQGNNCGSGVAAGASCTITVYFSPTETGLLEGALLISDSGANSPQVVYLSGTGTVPATTATVTPVSLTFATQAIDTTSAAKNVTVKNTGTTYGLIFTSIVISGTNGGDFAQTNTCTGSIAPGKSCTISVTFTPSGTGAQSGILTLTDSALSSPQTVSLTGTGEAQVTWTPTTLTFASTKVGTTSAAKKVTLTNELPSALSFTDVTFTGADPGDFAETNTCGSTVASKAKCTISVTFTPQATGTRTATMNLNDSANNSPQTVSLTGTGK